MGRFLAAHSYAGNGGTGQIRNAMWASHEEMGNLQKLWQSHEGAGSYESTLWTWHKYDSGGTNGVVHNQGRLGEFYYPNGAILEFRVGTHASGSWTNPDNYQDRLGQVTLLKLTPAGGGAQDVVAYKYNGSGRLVLADYVGPGVRRDMFDRSGGDPTADYAAWDRFGRTLRAQWDKYNTGAGVRDKVEYAYDYAGNRLSRNVAAAANDKYDYVYAYDAHMRLANAQAGTSSGGSITSRQLEQDWTLDQLGNWTTFKERDTDAGGTWDLDQARSHNSANELTEFATSSWFDPVLDAAGNMTTIPQPGDLPDDFTLVYDAWNRLVAVKDGSDFVQQSEYDGLNRRIVKLSYSGGSLAETRHYYYNDQWQVVEERVGTDGETARVDCQYVWHPEYIDALAMRYWDSNASGGPETAHYYLQDANYNVTALVNSSGDAVERYAYTPYGKATVLNGANGTDLDGAVTEWSDDSSQAGSDVKNVYLYTGRELDWETGLQINRNRYLHLQLGRWVTRDPIGYEGSQWNLYEYVENNPANSLDPTGMAAFYYYNDVCRCQGGAVAWNIYIYTTKNCRGVFDRCAFDACVECCTSPATLCGRLGIPLAPCVRLKTASCARKFGCFTF